MLSDPEILQKRVFSTDPKSFIKIFEQMDEERQLSARDKLFYARFLTVCSGVLVNWITNEYEETPMEIAMQLSV